MRILIAPDKFKDSLTAMEAAKAIEKGVKSALPDAECILLPLADGGEGTAALLTSLCGGISLTTMANNPLQNPIRCTWGYVKNEQQGFIELAEASGLQLLPEHLRNPLNTSTYGTGQLVKAAVDKGAKTLIIGLGGSATNDGGTGMAAALGYRFFDKNGKLIKVPAGRDLINIRNIDTAKVHPDLLKHDFLIKGACDVTNPLLGPEGAAYTFARQKGATEKMLPVLEEGMENLALVIEKGLGMKVAEREGSGAAGGAGAGVLAFLQGKLCSGAELILDYSKFREQLKHADFLITGEGKMDATSLQGKLIGKLCSLGSSANVPVAAFCGSSELPAEYYINNNLKAVIPVSLKECNLREALLNAHNNLVTATRSFFNEYKQTFEYRQKKDCS